MEICGLTIKRDFLHYEVRCVIEKRRIKIYIAGKNTGAPNDKRKFDGHASNTVQNRLYMIFIVLI